MNATPQRFQWLVDGLYGAASDAARRAAYLYSSDSLIDQRDAAILIGNAGEWLVRYLIGAADAVLLANPRSATSQVILSRASKSTLSPENLSDLSSVQTVDFQSAIDLLNKLHPDQKMTAKLKAIAQLRNGALHLGLVDFDRLGAAITDLAMLVGEVHEFHSARSETEFWRDQLPLVETLREEHLSALRRRYESKLARHRQVLANFLPDHSESERELVLEAVENRPVRWTSGHDERFEPHVCPACGRKGQLRYYVEWDYARGRYEPDDFNEDGQPQTA